LRTLIELENLPTRANSMGIADIVDAREIVLPATGEAKPEAVRKSRRMRVQRHTLPPMLTFLGSWMLLRRD